MFDPVRSTLYPLVVGFLFLSGTLYSQTSIDDVHITPRETAPRMSGVELATASPVPGFANGALIRTSPDLVMVPVTITDDFNRPVTGLDQEKFEVFENKKLQPSKNFSSE